MRLYDFLHAAARDHAEAPALEGRGLRFNYGELEAAATRVHARLVALGLRRGDRVALLSGTDPHAIIFFWALVRLGAVPVDIPIHAGSPLLSTVLTELKPRAVLIDETLAARVPELEGVPGLRLGFGAPGTHSLLDAIHSPDTPEFPRTDTADEAPTLILYTSGTTGHPKGVMLSHTNLVSNVRAAVAAMDLEPGQRLLLVVPLFFVHGRMQLLSLTAMAGTICLTRGFLFPQRVLDDLVESRATMLSGVPFHFTTLMSRSRLHERSFPALRHVLITGGALPPGALLRLSRALPGVKLHTAYGLTEASPRVTYLGPEDVLTRRGAAGRPLAGVEVTIVASDGLPVPRGALGEVVVSGPGVMVDYVSGDARDSGRIDAHGRLHTGDLGVLDGEGYLHLFGRQSDLIKTAGERVFPGELEEILRKHGAVEDAAVFGLPDATLGERIVALVVARPSQDESARAELPHLLKTHTLRWVPFVRSPREIHLVPALPKTGSGKIDRRALPKALDRLHGAGP